MQLDFMAYKNTTMQLYRRILAPTLQLHELTRMEMDVLLFLANNPEYDTARDLVEIRRLSKSHVSAAVDALVQRQFLQRSQLPGNKKLIHLRLTPAAQPAIRDGQAAQKEFMTRLLVDFTPQEERQLFSLLNRLNHNAQAAADQLE